ncbi:MAG: LysM peptidoglycan-binding domain-containing protein [Bdellovibrio sp.]
MMNKLVILLACFSLAFQISSCTSKESQSDSEVAADVDSADLEKLEGDDSLKASGDNLASDQLPEDALGETPAAPAEKTTTTETTTTTTEKTVGDNAATTQETNVVTNTETLPADPLAPVNDIPTPSTDPALDAPAPVPQDTASMSEPAKLPERATTIVENPEPAKQASLQKVATTPWKVGKKWFNTVYFARPGDTLSGISQMVYGANKVSELKKGNPTFKSRGVKPGDKVYYNSPNRPDDSGKMMTYYEDNGLSPEVYVAKSGDNIRKVSKKLLGYGNAWKEVWAMNSVDSKGELPEGTELRYWKGSSVAAAPAKPKHEKHEKHEVAQANIQHEPQMPAMPEEPPMPPGQQAQADIPPPPPMPEQPPAEMAPPPPPPPAQHMPPPPPPPPQGMAHEMAPPPPPPPAQHMPPPPPPPAEAVNPPAPKPQAVADEAAPEKMDQDTTLALGVVGLAAAGLAALIVVRKKRKQRELEQQAMDSTHVGNI